MRSLKVAIRSSVVWGSLLFAGCSASDFKQPITAFSAATKVAAASFDEYANVLEKTKQDQNIADVVASPAKLTIPATDCKRQSKQCRLFISAAGGKEPLRSALLSNIRKVMSGLVVYAGDLDAIATADTGGEIKTALDGAKTNLIGLAKATDALNAQLGRKTTVEAQVTAIASPIADVLKIGLTAYAEHIKLEALRDATARMDSIFPDIVDLLVQVGFSNNDLNQSRMFAKFQSARADFDDAPSKEKLQVLQTAADAYNTTLTAKPGEVFTKLGDAHAALTTALQSPELNFERVFALIQQIADIATQLAADAKALDKALSPGTKS